MNVPMNSSSPRRGSAAFAAAFLLAACGPLSSLDDDEPVTVTGALQDADGPIEGHRVVLMTGLGLFDAIDIIGAGLNDQVWLCAEDDPPTSCDASRRTETDGSGGFQFNLTGADTKDSAGFAISFTALVEWEPGPSEPIAPSRTRARFVIDETLVTIPALESWMPRMESTVDNARYEMNYSSLANDLGHSAEAQRLDVYSETRSLASMDALGTTTFPPGVFGDYASPSWSLTSTRELSDGGTSFTLFYTSERQALPQGSLVPVSRGAECRVLMGESVTMESNGDCTFTDGDLASESFEAFDEDLCPPEPECEDVCDEEPSCEATVEFDFGEPRTFDTMVLRFVEEIGVDDPADRTFEVSPDGSTWTGLTVEEVLPRPLGPYRMLRISEPVEAQYLRVLGANFLNGAGELDLF